MLNRYKPEIKKHQIGTSIVNQFPVNRLSIIASPLAADEGNILQAADMGLYSSSGVWQGVNSSSQQKRQYVIRSCTGYSKSYRKRDCLSDNSGSCHEIVPHQDKKFNTFQTTHIIK
jgi:hypothetical protein